jgi:D-alanine-D-alanine ligase
MAKKHRLLEKHERRIQRSLLRLGYQIEILSVGDSLVELHRQLSMLQPDAVFNLVEEFAGHRKGDATVTCFLERSGFQITGSDGKALRLCRDKFRSKQPLRKAGLFTPRAVIIKKPEDLLGHAVVKLTMPVIVKPLFLDGSDLISNESVCLTIEQARCRARWLIERKREPCLIEEFIEGRELAVSVTAWPNYETWIIREMYRPIHCQRRAIATPVVKDGGPRTTKRPFFAPAKLGCRDRESVELACRNAFRALGLRSYARFDIVLTADGIPVFIEANPNCCLAPRAYGIERKGHFDRLISRIVNEALARSAR